MINIVIPMAGRGSRFENAGYTIPKPLIPINGRPMIQWVIDNIRPKYDHRFIFICQKNHLETYPNIRTTLKKFGEIVELTEITEGAACTVLAAKEFINNDDALMIANSDQYVDCDIDAYLDAMGSEDGLIMTFEANDPKWSYCRMEGKYVTEVIEKEVVSNVATVGIYNFKSGQAFVQAAEKMIEQDLRSNNEFYVAPAYNLMIEKGAKIVTYTIEGMYGLGTPEDLEHFLTTPYVKNTPISVR